MKEYIKERVLEAAEIILKGNTIRGAAKLCHISKSTLHADISKRLPKIDPELYKKVREVLDHNWKMKHIRGGRASARRFRNIEFKKKMIKELSKGQTFDHLEGSMREITVKRVM